MSGDDLGGGCAVLFVALFLLGAGVLIADPVGERRKGYERGRKEQFCVDHAGQWDNANVRCLAKSDTITVQVPK